MNYMHQSKETGPYHYLDSGLDNVWLIGGVEQHETSYGPATSIHDIDDLHLVIGLDIAESPNMTGQEFRFLRTELELSQRALAAIIKATEQQIHRWENNKTEIPGPAQVALAGYYIEAMNPDSRMKEHLDAIGKLDTQLGVLERRSFQRHNDHWKASA